MIEIVSLGLIVLAAGWALGRWLEAYRWSNNADRIQRIEWRGKLYKVHHEQ